MRIIFDQATPVPIRPYLEGHTVRTATQQGWDKLKNGDLLNAAEAAGHVHIVVEAVNAATPGTYAEVEIPFD